MSYLIVEQTALKGHGVMITATTTFPQSIYMASEAGHIAFPLAVQTLA